jgi:hypothetical protein
MQKQRKKPGAKRKTEDNKHFRSGGTFPPRLRKYFENPKKAGLKFSSKSSMLVAAMDALIEREIEREGVEL